MFVKLLAYTPNPEFVVATAAHVCYSKESVVDPSALIDKLLAMHHESPFEHVSFTFEIRGISRACLAQLTRHRLASFSVRSQRHTHCDDFDYVIPQEIENDPDAIQEFYDAMATIRKCYMRLSTGAKLEDARYVLPNACTTDLIVTMNARSLWNFFRQRCCNKAQWEIRELANEMLKLCYQVAPNIFKNAGPACCDGGCREGANRCNDFAGARRTNREVKGLQHVEQDLTKC